MISATLFTDQSFLHSTFSPQRYKILPGLGVHYNILLNITKIWPFRNVMTWCFLHTLIFWYTLVFLNRVPHERCSFTGCKFTQSACWKLGPMTSGPQCLNSISSERQEIVNHIYPYPVQLNSVIGWIYFSSRIEKEDEVFALFDCTSEIIEESRTHTGKIFTLHFTVRSISNHCHTASRKKVYTRYVAGTRDSIFGQADYKWWDGSAPFEGWFHETISCV